MNCSYTHTTIQNAESAFLVWKKLFYFIQQGCIHSKNDRKDLDIAKDFYFQINSILLSFLLIKRNLDNASRLTKKKKNT